MYKRNITQTKIMLPAITAVFPNIDVFVRAMAAIYSKFTQTSVSAITPGSLFLHRFFGPGAGSFASGFSINRNIVYTGWTRRLGSWFAPPRARVRMVGHYQPIERTRQPHGLPRGADDLLAARKRYASSGGKSVLHHF